MNLMAPNIVGCQTQCARSELRLVGGRVKEVHGWRVKLLESFFRSLYVLGVELGTLLMPVLLSANNCKDERVANAGTPQGQWGKRGEKERRLGSP